MVFAAALIVAFSGWADPIRTNFAGWDTNKDGSLGRAEIDTLVVRPEIAGPTAAAVATIKQLQRGKVDLKSFDLEDLAGLETTHAKKYEANMRRIRGKGTALFAAGDPDISKIHQGSIADCFVLAAIGSICERRPGVIRKLLVDKGAKGCDVLLPGGTIHVPWPTDTEICLGSGLEGQGLWLNVLEKSMGMVMAERKGKEAESVTDAISSGGSSAPILEALTGKDAQRAKFLGTPDPVAAWQAFAKDLTSNDRPGVVYTGNRELPPGINQKHAYAVISTDGVKVTLWNPHGNSFRPKGSPGLKNGYPTKDGRFTLPITEAASIFGVGTRIVE